MRKFAMIGLFLLLLLTSMGLVMAQEFVVEDNACLTGGVMEGKCDLLTDAEDDWAWTCGWYVQRYYTGEFTRDDVIDTCRGLIPVPPIPDSSAPVESCGIFFGGDYTLCLQGNHLRQDRGNDGSFEMSWIISSGSTLGYNGTCPAGTAFGGSEIANYMLSEPNFYGWLIGFGFGDYDDFCTVL